MRQSSLLQVPRKDTFLGSVDRLDARQAQRSDTKERVAFLAALGLVLLVGMSVRLIAIAGSDFPINDGGMFYRAITQIQAAHFHLPSELHYNGLTIPFAYPPLSFYVAGLISSSTGASLVQLLRILPLIFSGATIVAFMAFANEYSRDRTTVIAASLAFALVPRADRWEIMGGGLTRGLGFFFGILTLWQAYRLFTVQSRRTLVLTTVFGAVTCLSHIEFAWFVAFSAVIFFLAIGRSRLALRNSLIAGTGVLVLTGPWWATVLLHNGISAFFSAGHAGADALQNAVPLLLIFNLGEETWFPLFGALAALGIVLSLRGGRRLLPLWVLVTMILDPRNFQTEVMVPLSILVGIVVAQFLIPLMSETVGSSPHINSGLQDYDQRSDRFTRWLSPIFVAMMLSYGWISAVAAGGGSFTALSPDERDAMAWVQASTPANARFAVVTGDTWALDRSSEWFPVLSDRVSVATVQGYEWVPHDGFKQQKEVYKTLQECSTETPSCITDWSRSTGVTFDYVYVARREIQHGMFDNHVPCCTGLVELMKNDPDYVMIFQNTDATIFEHTSLSAVLTHSGTTPPVPQTRTQP